MLVSQSASLAADGLINLAAVKKVNERIQKAVKAYEPVVKYVKGKNKEFPVLTKVVLAVKTKKEANAFKAIVSANDQVADVTVTGEAGKFLLTFATKTAKAAKDMFTKTFKDPALAPKPLYFYVVSKKTKPEAPSAAKFKAKDVKHLAKRAVKIAMRKKLTAAVTELMPVYAKGAFPEVDALIKTTEAEIKKHIAKAEKVKVLVGGLREKIRAERTTNYASMVTEITPLLTAAGFKEKDIVLGKTMMGQTLYARTPSGHVVTIGLSDASALNKARKSAAE